MSLSTLLPPANEVCEGYVFTPVCQSFCSRGGSASSGACIWEGLHPGKGVRSESRGWDLHPGGLHPGKGLYPGGGLHPRVCIQEGLNPGELGRPLLPTSDNKGYGQRAGGMHPPWMHTCYILFLVTGILQVHVSLRIQWRRTNGQLLQHG